MYGWQIGFWVGGCSVPGAAAAAADPRIAAFPVTPRRRRSAHRGGDPAIGPGRRSPAASVPLGTAAAGARRSAAGDVQPRVLRCRPRSCGRLLPRDRQHRAAANWMPTFFQELGGMPIQEFAKYLMIAFVGGAPAR
jgi:AAHS family 4-hydroxybenzoate transporter-like MFS transporter